MSRSVPGAARNDTRRHIRRRALAAWTAAIVGIGALGLAGCTAPPQNAVGVYGGPAESPGSPTANAPRTIGVSVETRTDTRPTVVIDGEANPVVTSAAQQAAVTAILLTGRSPTTTRVRLTVGHRGGGLSSGAALTVAILAGIRGTHVRADVAILGTIRPDGGIGPAADSFATVAAAQKAGAHTIIVPPGTPLGPGGAGTPGTSAAAEPKLVVAGDIWAAYAAATTKSLPKGSAPAIPPTTPRYDAVMRPLVTARTERATALLAEVAAMSPAAVQAAHPYTATASGLLAQAASPGAGTGAAARLSLLALGYASGARDAGRAVDAMATAAPADVAAANAEPTATRVRDAVQTAMSAIGTTSVRTTNDALARVIANAGLADALSLGTLASAALDDHSPPPEVLRDQVVASQVAAALAVELANGAVDDVAAGSGPGAGLGGRFDDVAFAGLLRRAGDANAALVVPPATGVARLNRAVQDPGLATALTGGGAVLTLQMLARTTAAQRWANLGASLALYAETADLLAGNGGTDTAEASAFAQERLGAAIWTLIGSSVDASLLIAANQQARIDGAGADPTLQRSALGLRWRTDLAARSAAFIGGFAATGPGAA